MKIPFNNEAATEQDSGIMNIVSQISWQIAQKTEIFGGWIPEEPLKETGGWEVNPSSPTF